MVKKKRKKVNIKENIIFLLIGIVVALYGFYLIMLFFIGTPTKAIVISSTYSKKVGQSSNSFVYTLQYKFNVDEKQYTGSGYYVKKMYGSPADTVGVKYLKSNPKFNILENNLLLNSLLWLIIGFVVIVFNIKGFKKKKALLKKQKSLISKESIENIKDKTKINTKTSNSN